MEQDNIVQAGYAIAQRLGVTYNGPQFLHDTEFRFHVLTDPQTGGSFGATDEEQARTRLAEMREQFAKGKKNKV